MDKCEPVKPTGAKEGCTPEKVCLPTEVKPAPAVHSEGLPDGLSEADWSKRQRKNDNASVRVSEWDHRPIPPRLRDYFDELKLRMFKPFDVFQRLQLQRYWHHKTGIIGSFKRYMISEHGANWKIKLVRGSGRASKIIEVTLDYNSGIDSKHRATAASFWE